MAKAVVPEEKRRRRRPTRSGTVLSEQLILETALRMLREHGSTGLTARRLGLALDADPSTLYRYFRGMDDLTLAIGDALIGQALQGWRPTGEWRSDLRGLGLRIHAVYVGHPQAALLTANRVTGRAHELAADEAILDVLRTAGFPCRTRYGSTRPSSTRPWPSPHSTPPRWLCHAKVSEPTRTCGGRRTPACRTAHTPGSPRRRPPGDPHGRQRLSHRPRDAPGRRRGAVGGPARPAIEDRPPPLRGGPVPCGRSRRLPGTPGPPTVRLNRRAGASGRETGPVRERCGAWWRHTVWGVASSVQMVLPFGV